MLLPMLAEMTGSIHIGLAALGAATPILVQAILAIAFAEAIVFYALYLAPK